MAQDEMLLFHGRNRIRYGYARWGYTRGGGSIFHAGADVEGLDAVSYTHLHKKFNA